MGKVFCRLLIFFFNRRLEMGITLILLLVLTLGVLALLFLYFKDRKERGDIDKIAEPLSKVFEERFEKFERTNKEEFRLNREEYSKNAKSEREELRESIRLFRDQLSATMKEVADSQEKQLKIFSEQLNNLIATNDKKFEELKERVEKQLKEIQEKNEKKLEEMRVTVDEKLHDTLEKRLGESFKLVSERLEQVHKGLGDMQELARGVGDLKNMLTNVKTRGTWGEVQLLNLIEQILTPEQYETNVQTKKGSAERVELAVKLPGKDKEASETVWLPIDAKFPVEDYQRLQDAQEKGEMEAINEAFRGIERRIKEEARKISDKYLNPPKTTDFAIMFLPIEGLYAEALRIRGLAEFVQREYRVVLAGPTTLSALLNSLQMGFRTLAIEKRSSEVWKILSAVKTEFGKFGEVLDKTKKKLQEASNTIDAAATRTRVIERKLRDVEELPAGDSEKLLED